MIHMLIERIKESSIVNMENGFQEANSSLLFIRIIIILFKFKSRQQALLEFFKGLNRDNESWSLLFLVFDVIVSIMHISQHFERTWAHRIAQIVQAWLVGPCIKNDLLVKKLENLLRYYLTTFKLVLTPFFFLAWICALVTKLLIEFMILFSLHGYWYN